VWIQSICLIVPAGVVAAADDLEASKKQRRERGS
jgi:hypothetical protein